MRISAKARYGLAASIYMAQKYNAGEQITVISISEKLKISKIYLEQVFSLLKRAGIVISAKGSQGGYRLARKPSEISAFDILSSIEAGLFEKTAETVLKSNKTIEETMWETVFNGINNSIKNILSKISLQELLSKMEKKSAEDGYMYYV